MRLTRLYLLLSGSLLLFLFTYLALFCHPIGDDLSYAVLGRDNGFLQAGLHEYFRWNGRYISNFVVVVNPILAGSLFYQSCAILIILIIPLSFSHFLGSVFQLSIWNRLLITLFFTLLFIGSMPNIGEGIYWYTGAVSYTLGACLLLFTVSLLIRGKNTLAMITMFFAMGCSEVCMLYGLLIGILAFLLNRKYRILFIWSALLATVVYFAPGNDTRLSYFPENHQFFHSLWYSTLQTGRFTFKFLSIALTIASLLFIVYHKRLVQKLRITIPATDMAFGINLILPFVLIFLAAFPAYWSTGILGQHRTMNVAYFFWIISWFSCLHMILSRSSFTTAIPIKGIVFVAIPFALVAQKNVGNALTDIDEERHKVHDRVMKQRIRILHEAGGNDDLILLPRDLSGCKTLKIYELNDDPSYFVNHAYEIYYQTKPVFPKEIKGSTP